MLYKRGVLKDFSKFLDKHKKQKSSGDVLSKDILENFAKLTEKHLEPFFVGISFLIKLQSGNLRLSEVAAGDGL